MIQSIYYSIFFFAKRTQNNMNEQPQEFLNEINIKFAVSFQDNISKSSVFLNILWKMPEVL